MKITLVPYNPDSDEHNKFIWQVACEHKKTLADDTNNDPILVVQKMVRDSVPSLPRHFIVHVDGEKAGYIGALIDIQGVGYMEGASLKRYQRFFPAYRATMQFADIVFKQLKVRKLKAAIPVWNKPAETVVRAVGFRKEGLQKRELIYNGKETDIVEMALFPDYIIRNRIRGK